MNGGLRNAVVWSVVTIGLAAAVGVMGQGRGGTPAAPGAPAQADDGFPAGEGKAIVMANCTGCHGLDSIQNAKHDLAGWTETLGHMVTYGAPITDTQVPTIAAYLAKSFPTQPPADKKEDPDVAGERILNTACTTCHDLGPVTRRADDHDAWESTVYGMVGNGADVKDADIPILVDYLVKYYGPPKDAPKAPAGAATPAPTPAPATPPAGRGGRGARGQ